MYENVKTILTLFILEKQLMSNKNLFLKCHINMYILINV